MVKEELSIDNNLLFYGLTTLAKLV